MQAAVPMLAATDEYTDIKRIFEEYNIGCWCCSGNENGFFEQAPIYISIIALVPAPKNFHICFIIVS